ncbi:MAG: hypothetical protein SVS15_00360, partial [Thermodesulfobacteriota bacterium]|nr:hypothetical protein [Thermodesulfobacteriota bacterium]
MNETLRRIKKEAGAMPAGLELPSFYRVCAHELESSQKNFAEHPMLARLREDVIPFLRDNYGHGMEHAEKVAVEAGAIVLAESRRENVDTARYLALLAQISGLLHDVCRLEPDHAAKGAEMARTILHDYPLSAEDKEEICFAIASHEAFQPPPKPMDTDAELLSGALYDADKFRWGPDNFTTTLWEICDHQEWSLSEIVERFPDGVEKIKEIASTFRTGPGKKYGP